MREITAEVLNAVPLSKGCGPCNKCYFNIDGKENEHSVNCVINHLIEHGIDWDNENAREHLLRTWALYTLGLHKVSKRAGKRIKDWERME